jgi:hypothetical protein
MAVVGSQSPVGNNIYMDHFDKLASDSAQQKPSLWLRYDEDT